ncbi:hypothetical protein V6N13_121902 [Hibiscus sabdariffa]
MERRSASHVQDVAVNAVFVGKDGINDGHNSSAETSGHLGECERAGLGVENFSSKKEASNADGFQEG